MSRTRCEGTVLQVHTLSLSSPGRAACELAARPPGRRGRSGGRHVHPVHWHWQVSVSESAESFKFPPAAPRAPGRGRAAPVTVRRRPSGGPAQPRGPGVPDAPAGSRPDPSRSWWRPHRRRPPAAGRGASSPSRPSQPESEYHRSMLVLQVLPCHKRWPGHAASAAAAGAAQPSHGAAGCRGRRAGAAGPRPTVRGGTGQQA
jgi:hypothetical protein